MLSATSEYALRMMILLTEADGMPTTCAKLSEVGRIPPQYASKVLNLLRRAAMVKGQRGRYGGFVIGCDSSNTTLLDIVNVIEPLQRIEGCPLGRSEHAHQLCPLHSQIDTAIAQLEAALAQLTLRQLVEESDSAVLCQDASIANLTVSAQTT